MYIKTLFLFLTLTIFSACGAIASPAKTTNNWLNNPPSDTTQNFYAVGYGETQKDAKSDALSSISAKISVNVASNFSTSLTASRNNENEEILQTTKNEVVSQSKNIEYTDVKVIESQKDGSKWAVLVEVNRDILTATYERKLQKVDNELKAEWDVFKDAGIFEKLKLSVNIQEYLKQTDTFFPLLHALNKNFDDKKYTSRYLNYTKEMRKAKDELVFKIKSDENSQTLASLIRAELSKENAVFSDTKYNVLINIVTQAKKKKYASTNEKFANLTFALRKATITATDKSGNTVSNVVYKTKEGSSEGFKDALIRTSKYEKKIKAIGIISFITGK
jgi:hypothetical protein